MKVVHVVRQFSPQVGGLEEAVRNLCRALRDRGGVDCRVVTLDRLFNTGQRLPPVGRVDGLALERIPWRGSSRYPLAPSVVRHLGDADVVHVHAVDFFFDYLAWTRPLHRKALVATTHGGFFHTDFARTLKRAWFNGVTRLSSRAYDRIIATSENDASTFGAIARDRLVTIENGVDLSKFADASSGPPDRALIYFGRLTPHKNLHGLITLLAELRRRNPGWRLIVAGGEWGESTDALAAAAERLNVREALELVRDPDDRQLAGLIARSTYFASLSRYEGFGLTAVEAMSAGLVPVLSDIPTFRSFVADARVGVCLPTDDLPAMAARLEARHAGQENEGLAEERRRMRAFCAGFGWDDAADRHLAVYEAAAAARSP